MDMNYRVIVKFEGAKPAAFAYKHIDGAMTYAQDKSLHNAAGFAKVTVSDLKAKRVIYKFGRDLMGWK